MKTRATVKAVTREDLLNEYRDIPLVDLGYEHLKGIDNDEVLFVDGEEFFQKKTLFREKIEKYPFTIVDKVKGRPSESVKLV